jgi:enoyl-CoA hydratase/carnithine racemase
MTVTLSRYRDYEHGTGKFDEPYDGVLRFTIDRPKQRNALSGEFHESLPRLFAEIGDDRAVKLFMLTATGTTFCGGADVGEVMFERNAGQLVELQRLAARIITRLLEVPQPTICAVNGPATGLAVSLALHFDFIVASEEAYFWDTHAAFGSAPGDGLILIAMQALGPALAREILFGNRRLSAEEALRHGLVNRVVPPEELEASTLELIETVLGMSPLAVRLGKMLVNAPLRAAAEEVLLRATSAEMITLASEDWRNAVEEFRQHKRFTTDWLGR